MIRRFFLLPLASLTLLSGASISASAQTVTDPGQVRSGAYDVETTHTQVGFSVLHFGFTNYQGLFSDVSGALTLDDSHPETSRLSVTIPVASVQTTSTRLTEELKGAQWFNTSRYPNATFTSTTIRRTGQSDAIVTGNLTLHGITKPETLTVHFIGAGINPLDKKYTVGFEATGTIRRSDFGVKMYVPYVSDDVQLRIAGAFEKRD